MVIRMDMKKDMNIMGIIGIIGAIILIVGVFLTWGTLDLGFLGEEKLTGMDFFNKADGVLDDTKYTFVPLVALICGIISLVLMIVPTFMNTEKFQTINNILGIVALVLAAVVIIFGILFATQSFEYLNVSHKFTYYYKLGIGYWLTLIGAIITFVGGIMPILKNKGIIKF